MKMVQITYRIDKKDWLADIPYDESLSTLEIDGHIMKTLKKRYKYMGNYQIVKFYT